MKKILFTLLLAAYTLASCSDDNNGDGKNITVPNESQLTQTVYADQITGNSGVNFTTTDSWTSSIAQVGGGASWISITPNHGSAGSHSISIVLNENDTGVKRTAKITITCNGQTVTITVNQENTTQSGEVLKRVTDVTLNKSSLTLAIGDTEPLVATIEPSDATNKKVEWSSNNTNVATVDATGKVIAVAKGTARITVKSMDDQTKTDFCDVTVNNPVQVTDVTLNKNTLALTIGNSETLIATVEPADATDKTIEWSSNNTNVATVDQTGKVTAVAIGTAQITAKSADNPAKEDYCDVTVNDLIQGTLTINNANTYNFKSIGVNCGKAPLGPGYTIQYIATTADAGHFAISIFFDEKKTAPETGTFIVGTAANLRNNEIFTSTVMAPGLITSLQSGVQVSVEAGADMIRISCSGTTKSGDLINFSYAGTYTLFLDPAIL